MTESSPTPAETKACPASDTGCIPGEAHCPSKHRCSQDKYWLFKAAQDGCLPCVQRMVRQGGIDPCSTSDTQGYTALDFANWAKERGVAGAQEVAAFLAQETGADSDDGWSVVQLECTPGVSHPPTKRRRALRKYWLFGAARAGCLRCVRHYIDVEGVDPASKSDTHGWSALDFAVWARQQGVVGAAEVETFMAQKIA